MRMIGMVRVVFEKRVVSEADVAMLRSWHRGKKMLEIEVLHHEVFETDFCAPYGPAHVAGDITVELGVADQVADAAIALAPGFYELVGEVHYEYHPGNSTPDHPPEPDAWWELHNEKIEQLTPEQAKFFYEPCKPVGRSEK